MFRDANAIERDATSAADVCIIGAGAAGIAIARELRGSGLSVCLLESGGLEGDPETQALYAGSTSGSYIGPRRAYLLRSRLRYFGGSTNHWAGICRPLDPIDFETRSWIPHSGWPFARSALDPYYERAAALVQIRPFADGADAATRVARLSFRGDVGIQTNLYYVGPATRFGTRYRPDLARAADVEVLLHANAVNLQSDPEERRLEHVDVATLAGNRFRVRARATVLASGGLENPRLLLASNRVRPQGLGNAHDVVGRYFMDHLFHLSDPGDVVFAEPAERLGLYETARFDEDLGHARYALFALAPELQRAQQLPNHGFGRISLRREPTPLGGALASLTSELAALAGVGSDGTSEAYLGISSEPIPDPDNRVTLTRKPDALGVPRLRLHWGLGEADRRGLERGLRAFAAEVGRSLRGRVRVRIGPGYPLQRLQFAQHHIGTTRMHDDPRRGVVDADCRVHGMEDLYVAGSSVFPTSGQANPTLTIVALALRLADHLRERLRS